MANDFSTINANFFKTVCKSSFGKLSVKKSKFTFSIVKTDINDFVNKPGVIRPSSVDIRI